MSEYICLQHLIQWRNQTFSHDAPEVSKVAVIWKKQVASVDVCGAKQLKGQLSHDPKARPGPFQPLQQLGVLSAGDCNLQHINEQNTNMITISPIQYQDM